MLAHLHISALTKGKNKLSGLEVHQRRNIVNVRIHVDCVIGNVQQKYYILQSLITIDFLNKRHGEDIPLIDHIIHVSCALTNICNPIVPFD